ncbi:MAG: DNA repair protein RecO [Patescibacteria group bacterium]
MSSQYYKTEGLIIKKTPYGEADFLVRIFARDFGKIDVIARGARKSASKLNSHLDILNFIRFSFVKNGDRLSILTDAEIIELFDKWFLTGDKVAFVHRIIKTIDMVIPQEEADNELLKQVIIFLRSCVNFDLNKDYTQFLRWILSHEGYGSKIDLKTLPQELADGIMKLWPVSTI